MVYRVEVAGRIFQGTDPRALIRLAVQFRKAARADCRKIREERRPSSENSATYAQYTESRPLRLLHKSYAKC